MVGNVRVREKEANANFAGNYFITEWQYIKGFLARAGGKQACKYAGYQLISLRPTRQLFQIDYHPAPRVVTAVQCIWVHAVSVLSISFGQRTRATTCWKLRRKTGRYSPRSVDMKYGMH